MIFNAGAAAAAAAAAEAARLRAEEEESMTSYSDKELSEDWEFKILRTLTRKFHSPLELRRVLDEESQAGWILVEKFDDQRLRLKRPVSAREHDHNLSFDPYRTTYGTTEGMMALLVFGSIFGAMLIAGLFLILLKG